MFFSLINIHAQSSNKFKDDALQFSLEVVKTFFQKDNNMYLDKISDSIFSLTGKGIYLKKKINYRLTESFKEAVKDKSKTFQDYQAFYKYEVLTIEDLVKTYNIRLPNYYKPKESDYFFIGGYKKNFST